MGGEFFQPILLSVLSLCLCASVVHFFLGCPTPCGTMSLSGVTCVALGPSPDDLIGGRLSNLRGSIPKPRAKIATEAASARELRNRRTQVAGRASGITSRIGRWI